MRNQRALATACAAVAVLGLAAPVAVADGMGAGGGPSNDTGAVVGGTGTGVGGVGVGGVGVGGVGVGGLGVGNVGIGTLNGLGGFNGNGVGGFNGNGNGLGGFNGTGHFDGHFNGNISGNGNFNSNGRGDNFGNGRGDNFGNGRGDDFGNGRGDDFGNGPGGDFGGRGDGSPRNIVATPSVIAAGGRLTVTVNGCRGGTMTSRAFGSAPLSQLRDDTARGVANVFRDARPGRYDITVRCDGRTLTRPNAFTVLGGVQGGFGGSRITGAAPQDMAIGGALVGMALVGGGAFVLRRRQEKRV
jgi:LPXTG-motif cell wall-anchored protein